MPILVEQFIRSRAARRMSPGTIEFYRKKLKLWLKFCDGQEIKHVSQITPDDIRQYLLDLEAKGHNAGGQHAAFRALRTLLYWYEDEWEPEGWKNSIRKVPAPNLDKEILEPVGLDDVKAMIGKCTRGSFADCRDKAILLFLLDTGVRASELCALNLKDVDLVSGEVTVRRGKGGKFRHVSIGSTTRKAIRRYKGYRYDEAPGLWVAMNGERLSADGLRSMLRRRAELAGIPVPLPHAFRRAFALNYLRAGGDIFTLQRLMGHADISILRRYLSQTDGDLQTCHAAFGPVDRML